MSSTKEEAQKTTENMSRKSSKAESTVVKENGKNVNDEIFHLKIYKSCGISIKKPLVPLKIALFVWFGSGAVLFPFLSIFFKQRGLRLSELSIILSISPAFQAIGPTISGIIADKLGRSKPVLITNILLTILTVSCMLITPSMNDEGCEPQLVFIKCNGSVEITAKAGCSNQTSIDVESCKPKCPENTTEQCDRSLCSSIEVKKTYTFALSKQSNNTDMCLYNVTDSTILETPWCVDSSKSTCELLCTFVDRQNCSSSGSRIYLFIVNLVLITLMFTTVSNCYRFMDVTSMFLVQEHNSDFGRERIWSVIGILVFAPLSGFIVSATSPKGGAQRYDSAFYFFIAMVILTMLVASKLSIRINPPAKNMWKKTLKLLKDPEVLSFLLILFVMGTSWGFTKLFMFWYLEELKAPSILLGLVPAVESLFGLPFLLTSDWWIEKIGTTNMFLLAHLGYVIKCIGYSMIQNPWFALLIETTNVLTYHLLWVTVIRHCYHIAPEGLAATVISTAGGIHYTLGKGSGSLFGGLIMNAYGGSTAYGAVAIMCSTSGIIYAFYLYFRRLYKQGKHDMKDTKKIDKVDENCNKGIAGIYTVTQVMQNGSAL